MIDYFFSEQASWLRIFFISYILLSWIIAALLTDKAIKNIFNDEPESVSKLLSLCLSFIIYFFIGIPAMIFILFSTIKFLFSKSKNI